jgi:hypothetical protein
MLIVALILLSAYNGGVASKVDRVTYVYEKDEGSVPRPISYALRKLNEQGVASTELEVDPENGLGQIPTQDQIAVDAAKSAGLPALVVQSGLSVVKVVKSPTTVVHVADAVGIEIEEPS